MKKPRRLKRLKLYLFLFFFCATAIIAIGIWMVGRNQEGIVSKKQPLPSSQTPSQKEPLETPEKPARFCFKWDQDEFRIHKLLEGDPQNPFITRNRSEEFEARLIRELSPETSWTIQFNHAQTPAGVEQTIALEELEGQQCQQIQMKRWYKFLPGEIAPNEGGEMQIQYKRQFGETQQMARYAKGQGIAGFEAYKGEVPFKAELFSFLESCLTTELLLKLQAQEQPFKATCARLLDGVFGNIRSQLATAAVVLKTPKETELSLSHEGKEATTPFKLLATIKKQVPMGGDDFSELALKGSVQVDSETVSFLYEYTMPEPHGNEFYGGRVPALPRKASLLITKKGEEVEQLLLSGEIVRVLESYTRGSGSCEGILVEKAVESVKYRQYPKGTQEQALPKFELIEEMPISNEFHRSLMTLFREFTLPIIQERLTQKKAAFNLSMEKVLKTLEKESLLNFQDGRK